MLRRPTVEFDSQPVVGIPRNRWWYSPEYLGPFSGMFEDIPRNVWRHFRNIWRHSSECLATFPGIFGDIPRNVWRHSLEYLATFPGMFGDIPRNITFPLFPHSPHSVPRSCIPDYIHSRYSPIKFEFFL